ncbi:carboxymuconolactone decarboxylase family protein [Saccharopolyspora griseoalba]|uniref:Carboxymuconolactone decarboxylase family protein n=1 Tax=Saccharopolyspora griseoalba TaxID=1431848 RepID=A0ABW2LNW8_9PSEU
MRDRLDNLRTDAAEGFRAMFALEDFLRGGPVPNDLLHLVKLRVSQINGCAFCVDMHVKEAERGGESSERLHSVATWREATVFTEPERAAFELAESATRIADAPHGVPDDVWQRAQEHFGEQELSSLVLAIAAINAWNRISVANRTTPGAFAR